MQVILTELQISDLFFNYEKPKLSEVFASLANRPIKASKEVADELIEEALKAEAESFSELLNGQVEPQWLIDNYNSRV